MTTILRGACHCGQVEVSFETSVPVTELQVRACECSFCRSHGAKTVTDPNGRLMISAPRGALARYRFGLRTADYLICRTCGVYVAAVISDGREERATLNAAGTRLDGLWDRSAEPVSYDDEDAGRRRARRVANWMPAKIVQRSAAAGVS